MSTIGFLWGVLTGLAAVASLFFLRFWREAQDRLFLLFAIAFALLGTHWAVLAIVQPTVETRHQSYLLRLLAFVVILAAIVDKNRRRS